MWNQPLFHGALVLFSRKEHLEATIWMLGVLITTGLVIVSPLLENWLNKKSFFREDEIGHEFTVELPIQIKYCKILIYLINLASVHCFSHAKTIRSKWHQLNSSFCSILSDSRARLHGPESCLCY